MAEKKYYWLKLKNDFFAQPKIKKLRRIAGGDTYTIIYLKLQLLSLKTDAKLYFDGIEDSFIEEMALTIDEDIENVKVTIQFLMAQGLIEEVNTDEFILPETLENIGSETAVANRVRKHREHQKALHCNTDVTKCNTEIEIEKEKELELEIEKSKSKSKKPQKHKYGEYSHVLLTDDELLKLRTDYSNSDELITFLDEYIEMKGYKAKSHYLAIKKWVVDAVKERKPKQEKSIADIWRDA